MFDLRSVLASPSLYTFLQNIIRTKAHRREYVQKYLRAKEGDAILDIGCGPADVLYFLPPVKYYGFDMSQKYIDEAKRRFGERGIFTCQMVNEATVPQGVAFDIVIANNIMHHLSDSEVIKLLTMAKSCLRPGGRLVTSDGCHAPDEGLISRTLLSLDRGEFVREKEQYLALAHQVFSKVVPEVRRNVSNLPINTIILECTNE